MCSLIYVCTQLSKNKKENVKTTINLTTFNWIPSEEIEVEHFQDLYIYLATIPAFLQSHSSDCLIILHFFSSSENYLIILQFFLLLKINQTNWKLTKPTRTKIGNSFSSICHKKSPCDLIIPPPWNPQNAKNAPKLPKTTKNLKSLTF